MKSSSDPRHQKRRKTVRLLFAETFAHQSNLNQLARKVLAGKKEIDAQIKEAAPTWPVDKLNQIDLSILRLAIYELENKMAPPKVIIDEAVELAKEFGSENSPSFVNGVLGTIYKEHSDTEKEERGEGEEKETIKDDLNPEDSLKKKNSKKNKKKAKK